MWSIHIMAYLLIFRKKEILTHATTCMNPEDTMLSEISQSEKKKYCMISPISEASKVVKIRETESRMMVARGREGQGKGSCCLMGIKLQFCKMKEFWRLVAQHEC